MPAAHRAVALWQVGRKEDSLEPEMRRALPGWTCMIPPRIAALSRRLGLPGLELSASEAEAGRGSLLTGLFPVPQYTPPGGYHLDPSSGACLCPRRKSLSVEGHLGHRRTRRDAAYARHRAHSRRRRARKAAQRSVLQSRSRRTLSAEPDGTDERKSASSSPRPIMRAPTRSPAGSPRGPRS